MPVSVRTRLPTLNDRVSTCSSRPPTAPSVFGDRVGALELPQYLRLADDHGIETCGDAKEMPDGLPRFQVIKMALEVGSGVLPASEKTLDDRQRLDVIGRCQGDLDPVAGREDHRLRSAEVLQFVQRVGQFGFAESQLFAKVNGSGLVTEAGQQELHWMRRRSSCAWAIHAIAEQQSATMARMAAFRPRQPALTRKKISAR